LLGEQESRQHAGGHALQTVTAEDKGKFLGSSLLRGGLGHMSPFKVFSNF
jgi:hypothetical protein